jgi:hypothetical protein
MFVTGPRLSETNNWTTIERNCNLHFLNLKCQVEFTASKQIDIELVYYPACPSKYNPIEREWLCWTTTGTVKFSIEWTRFLVFAEQLVGMVILRLQMINGVYEKGVKLAKRRWQNRKNFHFANPDLKNGQLKFTSTSRANIVDIFFPS